MRDSFILYISQCDILSSLTDAQVGAVMKGIFRYVKENIYEELEDTVANVAYQFMINQISVDSEKYEKAAEAGRKGGAPAGNQNAKKNNPKQPKTTQNNPPCFENNPKQPKTTTPCFENNPKQPNVNVNVNDNVNVNENENDNVNDIAIYRAREENNDRPIESIIESTKFDEPVKDALKKYAVCCEDMGKPIGQESFNILIRELVSLAREPTMQVKIIEQSILKRWNGFYRLDTERDPPRNKSSGNRTKTHFSNSRTYDYDELERMLINT